MTGELRSSFQSPRKSFPLLFTLTCHSLASTNTKSTAIVLGFSVHIPVSALLLVLLSFCVGFPALTLSYASPDTSVMFLHCYLFVPCSTAWSLREQLNIQTLALLLLLEILVYICKNYSSVFQNKTNRSDFPIIFALRLNTRSDFLSSKIKCNVAFTWFSSCLSMVQFHMVIIFYNQDSEMFLCSAVFTGILLNLRFALITCKLAP